MPDVRRDVGHGVVDIPFHQHPALSAVVRLFGALAGFVVFAAMDSPDLDVGFRVGVQQDEVGEDRCVAVVAQWFENVRPASTSASAMRRSWLESTGR